MWTIKLCSLESTAALARALAHALLPVPISAPVPSLTNAPGRSVIPAISCILLRGDIGSGKTTLVRTLVQSLPGGHMAKVSSPSFTLCNSYPTTPPVLHCDLYRSEASLPDEIWEALDDARILTLIEWGEFVPQSALPKDYLDIRLETCESERLAVVEPHGDSARAAVLTLQHQDRMTR